LNELTGVVLVADEAEGDREGPPLVAFDELPEGSAVTSLCSGNEGTIFLGFFDALLFLVQVGRGRKSRIHRPFQHRVAGRRPRRAASRALHSAAIRVPRFGLGFAVGRVGGAIVGRPREGHRYENVRRKQGCGEGATAKGNLGGARRRAQPMKIVRVSLGRAARDYGRPLKGLSSSSSP
jgi:hypothetical protein